MAHGAVDWPGSRARRTSRGSCHRSRDRRAQAIGDQPEAKRRLHSKLGERWRSPRPVRKVRGIRGWARVSAHHGAQNSFAIAAAESPDRRGLASGKGIQVRSRQAARRQSSCYHPRRCLAVGEHMDSGRFNFWRLLICTRAITPPRVPAGLWPGSVLLRRGGWSLLLLLAVLAAGVALRHSQRDLPVPAPALDPPQASAPPGPSRPALRW